MIPQEAEPQKRSGRPKVVSWKGFLLAIVITIIITGLLFAANPEQKRINVGWTFLWILLTVEGWEYWKWKSLVPYPAFLLCVSLAYPIVFAVGGELLDARLLNAALNIIGLVIFSIMHYRGFKKAAIGQR